MTGAKPKKVRAPKAGPKPIHIHLPSVHVRSEDGSGFDYEEDLFLTERECDREVMCSIVLPGGASAVFRTRDRLMVKGKLAKAKGQPMAEPHMRYLNWLIAHYPRRAGPLAWFLQASELDPLLPRVRQRHIETPAARYGLRPAMRGNPKRATARAGILEGPRKR